MSKIINISEAASIAIHSTVAIAKSKNKLNANELAQMINVSKNHLSAVMQVLTKNGLIASERGPKGGFFLKKNAIEISNIKNKYTKIYNSISKERKKKEKNIEII